MREVICDSMSSTTGRWAVGKINAHDKDVKTENQIA